MLGSDAEGLGATPRRPSASRRRFLARGIALGALAAPAVIAMTSRAEASLLDDLPYGGRLFGTTMHGGGLANTQYPIQHAYRFRCERSGWVRSVRWQNKRNDGGRPGYALGDGGILQVDLRTDTSSGFPDMARAGLLGGTPPVGNVLDLPRFTNLTLIRPVYLEKDQRYHIVFNQLTRDYNRSVSVNCLQFVVGTGTGQRYQYWGNDLASIMFRPTWRIREDRAPIFQIQYVDGIVKGQGIINGRRAETLRIGGANLVRQTMLIPRAMTATALATHVYRTDDDTDPLTIRILDWQGRELDGVQIGGATISRSSGDFAGGAPIRWVSAALNRPVALEAGQSIRVVYSARAGSSFRIIPMQDGSADVDPEFGEPFTWDDKLISHRQSEYSTDGGRTWLQPLMFGLRGRPDSDLPLYFTLAL